MQNVSTTYRTLYEATHTTETKLEIYDAGGENLIHSYGDADIISLSTTRSLFKENSPSVGGTVSCEIDCDLFVGNYTIPRMAMLKPYVRLSEISNKYEVDANGEDVWFWSEINLSGVYADIYDDVVFDGDVVVPVGEGTRLEYVSGGTNAHDITGKYLKPPNGEFYKAEGSLRFNSRTSMSAPGGKGLTKSDRKYNNVSEWLPKGVYWIDTRSTDYSSGVTTIHGYDAMLKGEQLFSPEQTVQDWPRTDLQVLNGCTISGRQHDGVAQKMGVTIQQSSLALINNGYAIQYPGTTQGDGNIANGALTVREVLGYICAMYGLNATIDEDGTMRFVPLASQTNVADIGQSVSSFDNIPAFDAFGQVEVVTSERESLFYPTTASGRTLTLYSPWGVQTGQNVARNVYNIVNGYVYRPFNAENAIIDPALQLGDGVTVNGVTSVLNVINSDFGRAFTASISAPQDDEVDHEYPFTDRNTREVERIAATTQASLVVMADAIEAKVSNDEMQSAITQTAGEILAEVASDYYGKQTSVSITPQGLTVNSDGSITLSAGATFTISSGNFSIDENGNVNVAGTLSAAKVYASNLVTGSSGGSIGSAQNLLTHLYASGITTNTLHSVSEESSNYKVMLGGDVMATIGATGITPAGQSVITWADMRGGSGGTAVFG